MRYYDKFTRAFNYERVSGKIQKISATCNFFKIKLKGSKIRTKSTKEMPCDLAKLLKESNDEFKDMAIRKTTALELAYRYKDKDFISHLSSSSVKKHAIGDEILIAVKNQTLKPSC